MTKKAKIIARAGQAEEDWVAMTIQSKKADTIGGTETTMASVAMALAISMIVVGAREGRTATVKEVGAIVRGIRGIEMETEEVLRRRNRSGWKIASRQALKTISERWACRATKSSFRNGRKL
jgi:hypothetical protein